MKIEVGKIYIDDSNTYRVIIRENRGIYKFQDSHGNNYDIAGMRSTKGRLVSVKPMSEIVEEYVSAQQEQLGILVTLDNLEEIIRYGSQP